MARFFVVVAHVVVLGQIATPNVSTDQADAQVEPTLTQFHAFGADLSIAWRDFLDKLDV